MTRADSFRLSLAAFALAFAAPALAEDSRLQTLVFDEMAVVRDRRQGEGPDHYQVRPRRGDRECRDRRQRGLAGAAPTKAQTILFVKPLETSARTNMTGGDDKRTYLFDLVASPRNASALRSAFRYPELEKAEEEARLAAAAEAEREAARLAASPGGTRGSE